MDKVVLEDDHFCFACGSQNKEGLNVQWVVEGKTTHTTFVAEKKFQGWKGVVHGGILATLLDEAMTRLAWIVCGGALTAEITVRYLEPAKVGEKLFVFGEIVSENKRISQMVSYISRGGQDGPVVARATGKAVRVGKRSSGN